MDSSRFDALMRDLASQPSRRRFVRGMVGGALGLVGLGSVAPVAAAGSKVTICHWDADAGVYRKITVSANALNGHAGHAKDRLFNSPAACGDCYNACSGNQICQNGKCVCQSTSDCPAGQVCADGACVVGCDTEGAMECSGSGFITCDHGSWVYRDCAPGTSCRPFNSSILCDWP